jgi:hypothetical protein
MLVRLLYASRAVDDVSQEELLKISESATIDPYGVSGTASMALLGELMATALIVGRADSSPSPVRLPATVLP